MVTFTDDDVKRSIVEDTGIRPEWAAEAFPDAAEDVAQSIRRIRANPFIPPTDAVRGFVFDVATGRLDEVAAQLIGGDGNGGCPRLRAPAVDVPPERGSAPGDQAARGVPPNPEPPNPPRPRSRHASRVPRTIADIRRRVPMPGAPTDPRTAAILLIHFIVGIPSAQGADQCVRRRRVVARACAAAGR